MVNVVLIWVVAFMVNGTPSIQSVKDPTKTFDSKAACEKFAADHTKRMEDWVRGVIRAEWDYPVGVDHKCEVDGIPS